jgi:hypothetical protein
MKLTKVPLAAPALAMVLAAAPAVAQQRSDQTTSASSLPQTTVFHGTSPAATPRPPPSNAQEFVIRPISTPDKGSSGLPQASIGPAPTTTVFHGAPQSISNPAGAAGSDTSGINRRFDSRGFDQRFDTGGLNRGGFDTSGFDRRFDASGFDRGYDIRGFDPSR